MCGISGIFDTQGTRAYSRELIVRINDAQAHRGPDEHDVHLEPGLALGHRRLSVIDLAAGQQRAALAVQVRLKTCGSICLGFLRVHLT